MRLIAIRSLNDHLLRSSAKSLGSTAGRQRCGCHLQKVPATHPTSLANPTSGTILVQHTDLSDMPRWTPIEIVAAYLHSILQRTKTIHAVQAVALSVPTREHRRLLQRR